MVKDRLQDLRNRMSVVYASSEDVTLDIELNEYQKEIAQTLDKFSEVTEWINSIRENVDIMKKKVAQSSFHYNDKEIKNFVDERIETCVGLCQKIHSSIKTLETDVNDGVTILERIRRTQIMLTKDYYLRTYREYAEFVDSYMDKIKKIVTKEAQIISMNLTEDETEDLLASGNKSLFVDNILEETHHCQQQLRDIMARHNELEKLEKSLIEVRDLFVRMATLVFEQGALIQVVEYHAQQTVSNVDRAEKTLEKARDLKIKALKKRTCILIWVAVALAVLVLILVVF